MANSRLNISDKSGSGGSGRSNIKSMISRAIVAKSDWPDKDEFLDVIYWSRQVVGILFGMIWGTLLFKGFFAIALFAGINCGLVYLYSINFQEIDEEAYGGAWELMKEGFMTSFAGFLVTWIIFYTGLHSES